MEKIWFIYSSTDTKVSGPYTAEQVRFKVESGEVTPNCHIWWKGQREWISVKTWITHSEQITKNREEKTKSAVWYVDQGGQPLGPLTQTEMIDVLKGVTNLAKVRLWTVGLEKWTNLYEFHDVMDELGMSRREHERAPLMGTVAISRPGDSVPPTIMRAISISIAGLGINDAQTLAKGEEVHLLIKSNEFPAPIRMRANTIYVTPSGHAGLKFSHLQPEIQSIIFDYVKKFSTANTKAA